MARERDLERHQRLDTIGPDAPHPPRVLVELERMQASVT
jgi:hypothetical protein